jgi:uncharacterized Zn-binding protein involved in type VI secretion
MPPAARLTDMHTCPMLTPGVPPIPHVGGPIVSPGEPTVLIEFLPAARVTDMAICVGPPDTIAMGSPTVLIGGLMAARMGDSTMHGGVIVIGAPTVIIGEAGSGGGGGAGGLGGVMAGLATSVPTSSFIAIASKYSSPATPGSATVVAKAGDTPEARKEFATQFYKATGWSDDDISDHVDAIDTSKPVELVTLPAGTVVQQWVNPKKGVGNYFDGDSPPEELGIPPSNVVPRKLESFVVTRDTVVLRSTAAPLTVGWIPGVAPINVPGGATQMFALPVNNSNFSLKGQ